LSSFLNIFLENSSFLPKLNSSPTSKDKLTETQTEQIVTIFAEQKKIRQNPFNPFNPRSIFSS